MASGGLHPSQQVLDPPMQEIILKITLILCCQETLLSKVNPQRFGQKLIYYF